MICTVFRGRPKTSLFNMYKTKNGQQPEHWLPYVKTSIIYKEFHTAWRQANISMKGRWPTKIPFFLICILPPPPPAQSGYNPVFPHTYGYIILSATYSAQNSYCTRRTSGRCNGREQNKILIRRLVYIERFPLSQTVLYNLVCLRGHNPHWFQHAQNCSFSIGSGNKGQLCYEVYHTNMWEHCSQYFDLIFPNNVTAEDWGMCRRIVDSLYEINIAES